MCKEGWFFGLGQEGIVWGWGKLSEIPQKGGGKEGGGGGETRDKDLEKGGKLGQGMGALKREGLCIYILIFQQKVISNWL